MARLDLESDRIADPTIWPDRCARCGAHGTTLVAVPERFTKNQIGWRVPLCPAHLDDWGQVSKKNRIGMVVLLLGMAIAFGVTWFVHPRLVVNPNEFSRFLASSMMSFLSAIPMGTILALWAKTPIRIESVQGRFVSIVGLGRAFKAAVVDTATPVPLPDVVEEVRFDVIPYTPKPTASPEAVGLLMMASMMFGSALGFCVAMVGLEVAEFTSTWEPSDWRYVGLIVLCAAIFGLVLSLSAGRFPGTRLGVVVLMGGCAMVAGASVLSKWLGFPTRSQFGLAFTGFPLVYLGMAILSPIVWGRRIRHPLSAGLGGMFGPLVYAGVVWAVAGLSPGPQQFAFGVGPFFALLLALILSSAARSPSCGECDGWLIARRLGSVARTREEMEPIIAGGGIVALSAAKTYPAKASLRDTELTMHSCQACQDRGTLVVELAECRGAGKQNTPALFRVGRWKYPGTARPVLDALFPQAEEDADTAPAP